MRRMHLFELHEQPWYPKPWRELFQLSLGRVMSMGGALGNMSQIIRDFLAELRPVSILDLCTGSGELAVDLWKDVSSSIDSAFRPKIVLSDLFPNTVSYTRLSEADPDIVDYFAHPVDALDPPDEAPRVWMMLESLHHFRPDSARKILESAARKADGIIVIESTQRTARNLIQVVLALPFITVVSTVFLIRPFRFRNILWGALIPVIPLTTTFDGFVSNLRTYTVQELEEMTASIECDDFEWKIGNAELAGTGGLQATYLFGWRKSSVQLEPERLTKRDS